MSSLLKLFNPGSMAAVLRFPAASACCRGACATQVKRQSAEVWQFILDREIEAPARFQAIQTQRAAAAILRQQVPKTLTVCEVGYT